jgi:hypothetical protein
MTPTAQVPSHHSRVSYERPNSLHDGCCDDAQEGYGQGASHIHVKLLPPYSGGGSDGYLWGSILGGARIESSP